MKLAINHLLTTLLIAIVTTQAIIAQDTAKAHEVNVGDFTTLRVVNNINVVYHAVEDSAGYVKFFTTSKVANQIFLMNNGKGKLVIQAAEDAVNPALLPTIHVFSKTLQEAINDGNKTLTVDAVITTPKFTGATSGNGQVLIKSLNCNETVLKIVTGKGFVKAGGQTHNLSCGNLGTGKIDALQLKAKEINCNLVGTGTILCNSTGGKLTVKGTGTGKVFYTGNPSKISLKKLGPLKVLPYTK